MGEYAEKSKLNRLVGPEPENSKIVKIYTHTIVFLREFADFCENLPNFVKIDS